LAINRLWGGFDVVLGGLARHPALRILRSAFAPGWALPGFAQFPAFISAFYFLLSVFTESIKVIPGECPANLP
jgi:hypothetical protein